MHLARTTLKSLAAFGDRFSSPPAGPRILIYHQVGAGIGRQMEVMTADFELQMHWLAENRRVVDLDFAIENWASPDSEQFVVLTFDDGYKDVVTNAFPLLERLRFPFTLYLATESVETGRPLGGVPLANPMSWEDIEGLQRSNLVTIGAHTHSHPDMRTTSEDEIRHEVETSNELIHARLGVVPRHFAYPWGYWSNEAGPIIREAYETAVLGGTPRPDPVPDRHLIHRYPVQLADGVRHFVDRLSGGLRIEERVRRRLAGYSGP